MIVFKTFLKVVNKCKIPIILYTVILVFFSGFNTVNNDNSTSFVAAKPDVLIINEDEEKGITENFIQYIEENSNIIEIENEKEKIEDALFYRDVNYIIYIPKNFRKDFLDHKNPTISIKSTGDYQASLANMLTKKYLKVATSYHEVIEDEELLIERITDTLKKETKVEITSKLDTSALEKATMYYNFTNYCILAGSIYVICLVLSTFKDEKIRKRTVISSMSYKKYNRYLLYSNGLFALVLWLFYVILSFIVVGNIMFSMHGLFYIINSFLFMVCALTIAFLIGNFLIDKNAINGLVNVIALGSSFLCGAFVPPEYLPDTVLKIAHVLPSYWFIHTNQTIKTIEVFDWNSISPMMINFAVLIFFSVIFILITNRVSYHKRKIG